MEACRQVGQNAGVGRGAGMNIGDWEDICALSIACSMEKHEVLTKISAIVALDRDPSQLDFIARSRPIDAHPHPPSLDVKR